VGNLLVDERDQMFILYEMLEIDNLRKFPVFEDHPDFDMVLNEAHKFSVSEFMPTSVEGDKEGCTWDPKTTDVKVPACFHKPYKNYHEGGWLSMCDSPDVGGSDLPLVLGTAVSEVFYAGSFCIYGAVELSHAGAKVLEIFGTDEQKTLYMERLYSGEWMGTMCLTEPDAGSDVGAVKTAAKINDDGSYSISGTKIFITSGEHDLVENIIHMVLARVEGDPPGTEGLSLFIVPKHIANDKGELVERNDVYCTGIEHKMGIHGLSTCTLSFGDSNKCKGYLLGEQRKGIKEMFFMMNEQRLLVGLEGLSISSCAFLNAVDYSKNRLQGTSVYESQKGSTASVPIIQHPDIKRMLLTMKAYVEGCRAMTYYVSHCMDYIRVTEGEESKRWQSIVDILIPVVKAYNTDRSWDVTGLAMQCAGGYGYCSDYPFERFARDCKITAIFEGANGIHGIDLMFRKLTMNKLVSFKNLVSEIDRTVAEASQVEAIKKCAGIVDRVKGELAQVINDFMAAYEEGETLDLYAKASPLLQVLGDVMLGWMHLWQLTVSYPKLLGYTGSATGDALKDKITESKEAAYYNGKVLSSRFYIESMLVKTTGKIEGLRSDSEPVIDIFEESFTG